MTAGLARYGQILRAPLVLSTFGTVLLTRAPIGFYGLAFILFLKHETGSYAVAGSVAAVFIATAGIGSPVQGRLLDRHGHRRVLVPCAFGHSAFVVLLVVVTLAAAPTAVLVAAAAGAGLLIPPMSSVMRTLWPGLLDNDKGLLSAAFALDGVATELIFVIGPVIVAVVTALFSPQVAVLVGAVLVSLGTTLFVATKPSREWRPMTAGERPGGLLGALASPGLRTIVACTLPLGFCFGAVEVALPAFCDEEADRALSGVLLAVWAASSAVGGLIYGARETGRGLPARYVLLAALVPLGYLPLAAAPSVPVMILLLIPAGMCIAPVLTAGQLLVAEVASGGVVTEAYTWPMTALTVGLGAGNVTAGALAEHVSWESAFLASAAAALIGAVVAAVRRPTLQRPSSTA